MSLRKRLGNPIGEPNPQRAGQIVRERQIQNEWFLLVCGEKLGAQTLGQCGNCRAGLFGRHGKKLLSSAWGTKHPGHPH
jgi:hypothetical protein